MINRVIVIGLLLALYSSFLFHKINLVTADLGRHIKNGEIFFQTGKILSTNFYSYTQANFHIINHHWGAGVIFFLIWRAFGFIGLQLFFIILSLGTFLIFFFLTERKAGYQIAVLTSVFTIPLLAERTEIRPEVFTYLFSGIFILFLFHFRDRKIPLRLLFILPVIEIFWVNVHVFFFFGPAIVLAFLLQNRKLLPTFLLTSLATLVNPFGLKAALYPATILSNYGYTIVENQPVWFIEKLISDPNFTIFKIAFVVLALSFVVSFKKTRILDLSLVVLSIAFSLSAWFQIRNFTLFGFFALPTIASNLGASFDTTKLKLERFLIPSLITLILILHSEGILARFPYWHEAGLGLERGNENSAKFLIDKDIKGPILNDYDIGSYLIFYLPGQKVFVDNRPEAYPTSFFKNIYIPMLEDEKFWQRQEEKYKFNTIAFSVVDATPWGQKFLESRLSDKTWAPVYLDKYIIVFLKRNDQNKNLIAQYEIPLNK